MRKSRNWGMKILKIYSWRQNPLNNVELGCLKWIVLIELSGSSFKNNLKFLVTLWSSLQLMWQAHISCEPQRSNTFTFSLYYSLFWTRSKSIIISYKNIIVFSRCISFRYLQGGLWELWITEEEKYQQCFYWNCQLRIRCLVLIFNTLAESFEIPSGLLRITVSLNSPWSEAT